MLALDLANTWDPYLAEPERLPDVAALRAFLAEYGIDGPVGKQELDRLRVLRGRLLSVFTAASSDDLVARLNRLIAEVATGAAVVRRADGRWALTITHRAQRRVAERLAAIAVTELTDLISSVGPDRIHACLADPCREVFVDTSRNGRRVYCSRRCANRVNTARHRRRTAEPVL